MATVQAYTKSGVDAKFNSRSNMTMVHGGGGSPDISAYPDAKTGDVIERSSDGARWGVVASSINPIAGRVVSVAGKTGVVTLGPGDVGAAPAQHTHTKSQITDLKLGPSDVGAAPVSHTHTKSQITDLNASTSATANSIAQRGTGGVLVVGTPTDTTHATTKAYVDSRITDDISWSNLSGKPSTFTPSTHTHTMANITNLPSVTNAVTNNAIVQRTSSGQVSVPATPVSTGDAASKAYVDSTVTAGVTWSSLAGKPSTFPPATHNHTKAQISNLNDSATATANSIALRDSGGRLAVATPTGATHATTKAYVDSTVSAGATWSSLAGKPSTFPPSTHSHDYIQIANRPKFDMGYNVVGVDTMPEEFPGGVSYALSNAGSLGWNEAILSDIPNAALGNFWMILTARQIYYTGSTIQQLYAYDRAGLPIYMRTWDHDNDAWGPFRTITDDGHKHSSSDISDSTDVLHASHPSKMLKTRADGQLYIYTDTIKNNTHATNKQYVDQQVNTRAATSHTHTSDNITDAVTYASGSTTNGNKLLKTDSAGRVTASNPTSNNHVANKSYVDSQISSKTTWANTSGKPSTFPPSTHTHTVAQISNLTLSQTATGSSVVQRDSSGRATVATPSSTGHATTKAYVDNAVNASKAWSAITGKPSTFAPSSHNHTKAHITDLGDTTLHTANAIVKRTHTGHINVYVPSLPGHASNKQYVDDQVGTLSPWVGTQTQYDAITSKSSSRLYIIR